MPQSSEHDPPPWIEYGEFGERFVRYAVTPERIEAAVSGMAGRGMTIGPFSIGPAGLAGLVAEGSVGKPVIARSGPHVTFEVRVPVTMHVTVTLGGQRLRLEAVVEIDLTLHARTADPLLIVIDIPRIRSRDVSFVMRAQAVGAAFELLLDPIAALVQREVANRLNGMIADPAARRARVFDVEAIMNGVRSQHLSRVEFEWIDYAEFGRRFFPRIVTADRVREVVAGLAGRDIEVGPIHAGPREAATVAVEGTVRMPRLTERAGVDPVSFDLVVPVGLDITVDVLKANRYRAEVSIPLVLLARAADPLLIVIDVPPPEAEDVVVELEAQGWRARALGAVGQIRKQIAVQVVRVVRAELADASGRTIDVAARLDKIG
ncbi:hypothetical protein NDR87_17285 [Nocardia sp. CDC159]|uniref:Uncharacterized protein n=1 Tax=Nocardia pulmonis TaxID=2951408 RepID=A0A9X2E951_9NOCA|nr:MULTISPECIES: hypothetical protein [Nocardia]MCM6775910.1 hypothetical protein [Nocardia pulmonis]MCM6788114.1 hypothetical protein [Nocardia sp. CDC159]